MALDSLSKKGKVSLLTLPRNDFNATTQAAPRNDDDDVDTAPLMLVQLPSGWSAEDLKDAHFVAKSLQEQAALVVDPKKSSFALHRVETSNVLILVPPLSEQQASSKRQKLTADGQTLTPVPARLLEKGGSGASFLELRPKPLKLGELQDALPAYDAYSSSSNTSQGRTIESLAHDLQLSYHQVKEGLCKLEAFPVPDSQAFVRLSEEALQEAYHAIVSTLSEADDCQDYAITGIQPTSFIEQVLQRMSAEERFEQAESSILRHCIETLYKEKENSGQKVRLSVSKVAVCVARRLFQKQTTPWEETLFLSRWQSELPGVGDAYSVKLDMLRGIAIDIVQNEERFWKYLPADNLVPVSGREGGQVRNLGKPVSLARRYYREGADEIAFLNITSFRHGVIEDMPMLGVLEEASKSIFVPLTVGGGIRSYTDPDSGRTWSALEVAARYFRAGADKVSMGSDAVDAAERYYESGNTKTGTTSIEQISRVYGVQAVVISIDPKRVYVDKKDDSDSKHVIVELTDADQLGPNGERFCWYQCTVKGGRETRDICAVRVAQGTEALGAGEIMLNCIDMDGQGRGFDHALMRAVSTAVSIPVIASSGAGQPDHFTNVFQQTKVQAALAAGMFHRQEVEIETVKQHMRDHNIPARRRSH